MKLKLFTLSIVVLLVSGCKELSLPEIQIGNFSTKDLEKGLGIASKAYDAGKDITPEQEYYIGRSVAARILQRYTIYDNPKINNYLNTIGKLISMNSDQPEVFGGYHFTILDSNEINAFATPGGFIFITRGMLKMCKNEDELAAVLAHEISHVQLKHGLLSIKDSRWTSVATTLTSDVAKSYVEKKYDSQALDTLTSAFTNSLDDVIDTLVVSGYAREYEEQADQYALKILVSSGYSDFAMLSMLEKMDVTLEHDDRGFGATHPKASDRIAVIRDIVRFKSSDIFTSRTKRFQYFMKDV